MIKQIEKRKSETKDGLRRLRSMTSGIIELEEKRRAQPLFCDILDPRTQKLLKEHPSLGKASHFLVSNRLIR